MGLFDSSNYRLRDLLIDFAKSRVTMEEYKLAHTSEEQKARVGALLDRYETMIKDWAVQRYVNGINMDDGPEE